MRVRFSSRLTGRQVLDFLNGRKLSQGPTQSGSRPTSGSSKIPVQGDKFFELLNNFSINHELGISRMWLPGTDTTFITTNNVNMTGTMQLTPNWGVRIGNIGYDFISKKLTYPDIGLVRNLHCWELAFNFQPTRGTYTFHIGVKPGSLDFLKYSSNRGNYDTPF